MNTVITYAGTQIDFKEDIDQLFASSKANSEYLANTFQSLTDAPADTWIQLNTNDPNYYLFVKSLVFIIENQYDQRSGFYLEFNQQGRPFDCMRKMLYSESECLIIKNNLTNKVVRLYNNLTFVPLSVRYLSISNFRKLKMAKKETVAKAKAPAAAAPQILLPETVNAKFAAAQKEMQERITEAQEIIEITTPEQAKKAAGIVKSFKPILAGIETTRKALKAPYKDAGDLIDAAAKKLTEDANPQKDRLEKLVLDWDNQVAIKKAADDKIAADARLAEEQKAEQEKQALQIASNNIVNFENAIATAIVNETDQEKLGELWEKQLAPFDPNQAPESLRPDAEAMKNRLISLGMCKDALLEVRALGERAPAGALEDAENNWKDQRDKYSHLANIATAAVETKVAEQASNIELNAEIAKSTITADQMSNVPEKNLGTRRTWKYRVTDITIVPAALTMTVINDDAVKEQMAIYKANIEAGEQGIPGIEFYCDVTASGR